MAFFPFQFNDMSFKPNDYTADPKINIPNTKGIILTIIKYNNIFLVTQPYLWSITELPNMSSPSSLKTAFYNREYCLLR